MWSVNKKYIPEKWFLLEKRKKKRKKKFGKHEDLQQQCRRNGWTSVIFLVKGVHQGFIAILTFAYPTKLILSVIYKEAPRSGSLQV